MFAFFWLLVDPRLIYHHMCPIFRTDGVFLREHLAEPGGMVEYLASLASQAYVCQWAGAAVIAGAILLVCLAASAWLSAVAGRRASWVALLAAAPLAAMHSMYHYPLHMTLALAVALAGAAAYSRWPARAFAARWAGFAALAAGVYYLAGAPVLLMGLLCGLRELLVARRWVLGSAILATAGVVPWLGASCCDLLSVAKAYTLCLPFPLEAGWPVASTALYALLPVTVVGMVLLAIARELGRAGWRWATGELPRAIPGGKAKGPQAGRVPAGHPARTRPEAAARAAPAGALPARASGWLRAWAVGQWLAATLLVLAAWAAWAWTSLDAMSRDTLRIDCLAAQKDWQGILREARRLPLAHVTPVVIHDVDLALFHTGRLPQEMFAYPQMRGMPGLTLLEPAGRESDIRWYAKAANLMLELGQVNEAEHLANEAIEMLGDRPQLLRTLFLVYVLKGQPVAASTYLTAMGRHILYAQEAQRYAELLRQDPSLEMLEDVRQIRQRMPTSDTPPHASIEQRLLVLLESNPRNRMAFEYLMAHYLLTLRPDRVAMNIARLKDFGQTEIPRHYEEAIVTLAYQFRASEKPVPIPLHGLQLRPGAQDRLETFLHACAKFGADVKAAQAALDDGRDGSYYIYCAFGKTNGGLR
jgi:tetratricopeptide (TPR) repeat protein